MPNTIPYQDFLKGYDMDGNNNIDLIGTAGGAPEYSHTVLSEAFFTLPLSVRRLSGTEDRLILTVSERLLAALGAEIEKGTRLTVNGQIRSYNRRTESGSRLFITVFARELFISGSGWAWM